MIGDGSKQKEGERVNGGMQKMKGQRVEELSKSGKGGEGVIEKE